MMVLATLLTLLILFPVPSTSTQKGYSSIIALKMNFVLISYVWSPYSVVDAVPPPEEVSKLKEKIRKGKLLLEELTEILADVKDAIKKGKPVDKSRVNKIEGIKDKFRQLQVDPGDLPRELLENFRDKTLEAFKLILQSFNVRAEEVPLIKKLEDSKNFDDRGNDLGRVFMDEL